MDAGVVQLMEACFGGGTRVGGRSYINAKRPGLQAVYERFLKALGYSAFIDRHAFYFVGNGCLDNGSMFSPEQFLLDMEMEHGMENLWTFPKVSPPGQAAERIAQIVLNEDGNFMACEHTLAHYRDEMWAPRYFQCLAETRTEKEILDRCHAEYRDKVDHYKPASHPSDILHAMEKIVKKAGYMAPK
jgi:trimethylamine:corrinoid methyltransferase-like protein